MAATARKGGQVRTPTFRTKRPGNPADAGFTLVELLAVITILALAAMTFTLSGTSSLESAKFRALLINTSAAISAGRIDAMRQMRQTVFVVDLQHFRMGFPDSGGTVALPPSVNLKATVAKSETYKDGTFGIRFYPNGSSSGGTLAFTQAGQTYELRVNWLTGNVTLHRM